jgi:hypothetical protein
MKQFQALGDQVFDYVVLTLLLLVSSLLILPLPMMVMAGIVFARTRSFISMFRFIREHLRFLVVLTGMSILLFGLLAIQVQVASNPLDPLSYLLIGPLGITMMVLLVYPPVILHRMHVKTGELIRNVLLLSLRQGKTTLFLSVITFLMVYVSVVSLYALLLLVPYLYTMSYVANRAFDVEYQRKGNSI